MPTQTNELVIFDAKAATGAGNKHLVADYDYAIITVNTASSANLTMKFAGSISETSPDFAAAQSVSNSFDYLDALDLEDGASIDGDTGFAVAGTDDHRLFRVDLTGLRWFTGVVTARSAGSVTAKVRLYCAN